MSGMQPKRKEIGAKDKPVNRTGGKPAVAPPPDPVLPSRLTTAPWQLESAIIILRLFLGISFLMAGLDKLGDPGYLDPSAPSYIGNQIAQMAAGTPLEGFLLNVAAPNATLFGVMVMGGELCIGVATLLGLLTRFSAIMGLLLNLTFFLSATWSVRPFYFGADLPYVAAWLSLALLGPGSYALDVLLARWLAGRSRQVFSTRTGQPLPPTSMLDTPVGRRTFVTAAGAGVVALVLAASGVEWGVLHAGSSRAQARAGVPTSPSAANTPAAEALPSTTAPATPAQGAVETATPEQAPQAAAPTDTPESAPPAAGQLIAPANSLPAGQALNFTLPTGDPAVLVHDDAGYSAYVAICTHQGCEVSYIARNNLLGCPCHGALFDPASGGSPVRGPARRPLSPVAITVGPDGGVYLSNS